MQAQITKIKNILLYLLGFVVGCDIHLAPAFVVAFALCWLLEGGFKKKLSAFVNNKYALLFVLFYVLHIIGLIYTPDRAAGGFDLQVKLSMLIFPIMLVSEGEMSFVQVKLFIESFVAGLCLGGLICLGYGCWRYFTEHVFIFEYMQFSIFHHPSYYSMYIDTALVMMFYLLTTKNAEIRKWEKVFLFSAIFFLAFMLVLLESKTGLLVSIIVFFVLFIRYVLITKHWYLGLAVISATVILGAVTYVYVIKPNGSRFSVAMNVLSGKQADTKSTESTQARLFAWQSAWKLIKEVPFTGVGTGEARTALTEQYKKDGFTGAEKERLNAHNEYLESAVELGAGGFFCLLACLLLPLYKSIKEHRFVYLMFLVILIINFLTESMFETQGGTIFYGLFNSLLMFNFVI